ncbi:MAG: sugar transferase [Altererythrobacter sp.]|nr:sugar transferase [Altererythrobacter sp.]
MLTANQQDANKRDMIGRQALAIVASIGISYVLRLAIAAPGENLSPLHLTVVSTFVASIIGLIVIRAFTRYPGTEAYSAALSGMTVGYGIAMAVLLIARIDYARGLLFGTYILTILLLFVQQIFWPARHRMTVAVINSEGLDGDSGLPVHRIAFEQPEQALPKVDAVTVDLRANLSAEWERRIVELALSNVPVYHIKHLREALTGQVELEHLSETSYGTLTPPIGYIILKRVVDSTVALAALVLIFPLFPLIAALIKIDSPGPAIFLQRRVGFRGRTFVVRKFRTMRCGDVQTDALSAAVTKHGDSRITRIGRHLRRTRLDEIPQLLNVLRGEMSLIGPRPEAEVLSLYYEREIPFYRYRHVVLPGVTGWAQINQGHVTDVKDVLSKLHFDFYYIKNLSPWLDALIAVRTLIVMFTGRGAR